jgi:hypothetical protein
MTKRTRFKYLPGLALVAMVASIGLASGGCSAATDVSQGCAGLAAASSQGQATMLAWVNAVDALNTAAAGVETEWLQVCNDMNSDLGLDTSPTTASAACAVLNKYIHMDLQNGVMVTLTVLPNCEADLKAQATCEGTCNAMANCDVHANCTGGDVEVSCNGACHGQCDVTAPSFACMGTCQGECTAMAAVSCSGECTGSCDAPTWTGTCDAGCSLTFSGTCGGNCNGMCTTATGTAMTTGACAGQCVGTCDAKANGSCMAACTGMFTGGQCSGMCKGKCNVMAGAMCNGMCNGTCSYTPGSATCTGECHATCDAPVSPPTCNGMLSCMGSEECHADCQGQASASLNCAPPQVTVQILGDAALAATFQSHLVELGNAAAQTAALTGPIGSVAGKTLATFSALGNVGLSGASCLASELQVATTASVHLQVCVSAQATVSGNAG